MRDIGESGRFADVSKKYQPAAVMHFAAYVSKLERQGRQCEFWY
jgi:hypothetical protein